MESKYSSPTLADAPCSHPCRPVLTILSGACLIALLCCVQVGCGGTKATEVELSATQSRAAQAELRALSEMWEVENEMGRRELRRRLEGYLQRYADDPSANRIRIMLAQIALTERRFASAEGMLIPLLKGPPGRAKDEANVILAAIDNRRGDPEQALAKLAALEGKLLTRAARDQYSRERATAAISARRWRLALNAMMAWLVEAGAESAPVKKWIQVAIVGVPHRAIYRLVSDWPDASQADEEAARAWVYRLLLETLTAEALSSHDPRLAKDLLALAPPWLRVSSEGRLLAELAALAKKEARVVGRTVGLVLGGKTNEERRRSVRVASGLRQALGLAQGTVSSERIRLLVAENLDSMSAALASLSGLGSTILLAGVEAEGAEDALVYAESRQVPVIVLSSPPNTSELKYGFLLGVSEQSQQELIQQGFPENKNWLFVGGEENPCHVETTGLVVGEFSLDEYKKTGVDALGLLGSSRCVSLVMAEITRLRWSPTIAIGLEGAFRSYVTDQPLYHLRSGAYPQIEHEVLSDDISEDEKQLERGLLPELPMPADWYFTLGRDAGLLAAAALKTLPETLVTEKEKVRLRHHRARDALLSVKVHLASSEALGFSKNHRIARQLIVERR